MNVYLKTFGCRANHADSESVRAMLLDSGHSLVTSPDDADVAVFNSCTVTAEADADLRQAMRRASRARTIVMGCLPANAPPDWIRGADLGEVARALGLPASAKRETAKQTGTRALLRIQDGCDEHCTFCATTIARGSSRSRTIAELLIETERLAEWHPEIVLTGVHIGSYGVDRSETLGLLVEALTARFPATRFRLSSIEATEVDDRLRGLLREGRVAPWLHAPLQSGSDRVLKRMGRHWYTSAAYESVVTELVRDRPIFGLGADVIAGFPGETEADHQATLALVERLPFTALHVFPYSPRPGTAAERLGPPVRSHERAAELRALAARKTASYLASRTGTRADVIAMGKRSGMTEDYLTVDLADPTVPRGTRFQGTLIARAPDRLTVTR